MNAIEPGAGIGKTNCYGVYAQYFVKKYIQAMKVRGDLLITITIQNEPFVWRKQLAWKCHASASETLLKFTWGRRSDAGITIN